VGGPKDGGRDGARCRRHSGRIPRVVRRRLRHDGDRKEGGRADHVGKRLEMVHDLLARLGKVWRGLFLALAGGAAEVRAGAARVAPEDPRRPQW
jgi:hypothetical protein